MRKHADTHFWISIFAPAFFFPVAAIAMFTVWFIRLDLPQPTIAIPSPTILAATRPVPPAQTQVEAAVTPPLEAVAEPAALPPAVQTPELLSIIPVLGNAPPVYADPARDASTAESPGMPAEPAAESLSPQAKQRTAGMAEAAAPQPDAKETERVFVPPMTGTLAVAPPMLRNTPPADADPARDASPPATLVKLTEPAAPEPSTLIVLPRPRPHITVANGSRTAPLPRPRPRPVVVHPGPLSSRP
jgi:hypothetical protein